MEKRNDIGDISALFHSCGSVLHGTWLAGAKRLSPRLNTA